MADDSGDEDTRGRRRSEERRAREQEAAVGPSAARWLLADEDDGPRGDDAGGAVPVDVVQDLLALDPRTTLGSRGESALRALAGRVERLVAAGVVTPSGQPLLEVLVVDREERAALFPSFDLEALLSDGPVRDTRYDRTVRLAEAMLERSSAHRDGTVDLYAEVAPPGAPRHRLADDLEATVRVATEDLSLPACSEPAVVATADGWVAASPVELFLTAARGVLQDTVGDVAGEALYAWLEHAAEGSDDPWLPALSARIPVDAPALLQQAAARAGSDHPEVAGAALVDLISVRHRVDPPDGG